MIERGIDLVTVRNDAGLLRHASAQVVAQLAEARSARRPS